MILATAFSPFGSIVRSGPVSLLFVLRRTFAMWCIFLVTCIALRLPLWSGFLLVRLALPPVSLAISLRLGSRRQ